MFVYSSVNLILLLLLDKNYPMIKSFYKKWSVSIGSIDAIYKFIILIPIIIFCIYIGNYRIINKKFNKNLLFWSSVFIFQIFSINIINANLINKEEIGVLLILFFILMVVGLFRIPLKDNKEKKYRKRFWILILVELFLISIIYLFMILNQIDVIRLFKEIYLENKEITGIKFIYFILKIIILIYLIIYTFFKIFPDMIEKNDLNRIEDNNKIKNTYQLFNKDKIEEIKNSSNEIKIFEFQNLEAKEEFIYMLKNEFGKDYKILYKKTKYYFNIYHFICNLKFKLFILNPILFNLELIYFNLELICSNLNLMHFDLNHINKIRFKPVILIIDNDNDYIKLEKLNNKFYTVVNILLKDDIIETRKRDIENLKKEIYIGKNSILIDNLWGTGKTFFVNKFMEKCEQDFEFIYIKVPYFSNKKEFRAKILEEIHSIFKKNRIITSSLNSMMTYFGISLNTLDLGFMKIDFNNLLKGNVENDYPKLLLEVKENLRYLNKKIIIILDDFDRIEDGTQIREILSFIGELILDLEGSISLITLSSQEVLLNSLEIKNEETKENYLDKYFDKTFYLSNSSFFELLDFFSESQGIDITKQEFVREMAELINNVNENLLKSKRINFRNMERFVKNLKTFKTENIDEYRNIYDKVFIFWEILEYLVPEYWNFFRKFDINLTKDKNETKEFYDKVKSSSIWEKDLLKIKSENNQKLIDSIFETVKKYKLAEYETPLSDYLDVKKLITKNHDIKQKNKYKFKDYLEVSEIFEFNFEERKKIFKFFMRNKNITQQEVLKLMIEYYLDFHWEYNNSEEFFEELKKNREKGESLGLDNGQTYHFLKRLLIVNKFIDFKVVKDLYEKEEELYLKNNETGYFLKSDEEFLKYFIEFKSCEIDREEFENFMNEVFVFRDAIFNQRDNNKEIIIENIKNDIVRVTNFYLKGELKKYLDLREEVLNKLKNIENKFGIEILNKSLEFVKEIDNLSYEMWKDEILLLGRETL